ncbi:MAG: corrinoid protein [Planctomycetes bacterium]|nr:corrinoid protein [Planctomycetota bacterium]
MSVVEVLSQAVLTGDDEQMPDLISQALDEGLPARRILNEGLLAGMAEVGRRFRENEFFIPEVLVAAGAMKAGLQLLRPHLARQGVQAAATAVIGTVKGDLHDIGKNLVAMMLEGAGFEVVDLGVDVSAEQFVEACRTHPVDLVALSALLTTTMPEMIGVVRLIRQELKPSPRVIIGGSPVTQQFTDEIGADGYARDAATGAEVARQLCMG